MTKEKIIVTRKRRFSESRYSVGIYINNEFIVSTIKDNRQEINLSAGKYILKVEQGNRSGETEIELKKGKVLTCNFSSTPLTYIIYFCFVLALIINYGLDPKADGTIFLYIPTIILTIYTYTIGRKKYFVFDEPIEDDSYLAD
ncbi:MAG: hypothetical protein ACXVPU_00575 [Bacteroidia bacterium]